MRTTRLVVHSLGALTRYRLRSAFVMVGSLVGVAALTLVVSVGQGVQDKVTRTVGQVLGDSSILVMSGGSRILGSPRAGASRLTIDDVNAVAAQLDEIDAQDPQQDIATVVRYRDRTATVRILGQSERGERVWTRTVNQGRYFDAAGVTSAARIAVIGETVARTLFPPDDPLEAEIRIGAVPFRVIGVLERFGTDMHGMDRDNEIIVPITTLMRRLTNTDTISAAKLVVKDPSRSEDMAREVTRILRARHALSSDEPDDFRIVTPTEVRKMTTWIRQVLLLFVPLLAGVVLLVAGIVAATLMLSSVNERIAEIGLRRAIGATPEDVRLQFATETAVTILIGGLGGLVVGYAGAVVVAARLQLGHAFSWQAVVVAITASAITGVLAGVVPARRAAQWHPADALR
jgi:putative ABC transport system permease protein